MVILWTLSVIYDVIAMVNRVELSELKQVTSRGSTITKDTSATSLYLLLFIWCTTFISLDLFLLLSILLPVSLALSISLSRARSLYV